MPSTGLDGMVVPRAALDAKTARSCWELFSRLYRCVDAPTFERDLHEKDWVLLLRDGAGRVQGFTTMMRYDIALDGRPVRALFSGNTVIDPVHWGDPSLVRTWTAFMAALKLDAPDVPLYWYLICSGYRTYLYLPLFYREFYPRYDAVTPPAMGRLLDELGRSKFPGEYRDGIVHVRDARECLDATLAVPAPRKLRNPHVRYFCERNADYLRGDELVCVAEFSAANTRRTAQRALLDGARFLAGEAVA